MSQEELRRSVNTDLFRQGSGDSGGEKGEIRDFMASGSENISPRYLTNTLPKRKNSRNQKRSVSRGSSRGGTPDSTLKRFNPRTDGFRHLFNSARRLHVNSDSGKIAWNEIRNLYRKETGRHLNSEELNLICGTVQKTKHDLLSDQLSVIFEAVDSKGLIVRLNTTNTPPTIPEDQEIAPNAPLSPQNVPAEENVKLMEEKRKVITENLIRRGLLTSDGRRSSATDSASTGSNEAAEEHLTEINEQVGTKEEEKIEVNVISVAPKDDVDVEETKEVALSTDSTALPEMETKETTVEVAFEKELTETEADITVEEHLPSESATDDKVELVELTDPQEQIESAETANKDNGEISIVVVDEQTEVTNEAEETSGQTEQSDATSEPVVQVEASLIHKNSEETTSIYENVNYGNDLEEEDDVEGAESNVTVEVELTLKEEENETESSVQNAPIVDVTEEAPAVVAFEEKDASEETLKVSSAQEDLEPAISEVRQDVELEMDCKEEEVARVVMDDVVEEKSTESKMEASSEDVIQHLERPTESIDRQSEVKKEETIVSTVHEKSPDVSMGSAVEKQPSEQANVVDTQKLESEDDVIPAIDEEAEVASQIAVSEVNSSREDVIEIQKPFESSFTTVTVEVELSKKFECVTTASFTPEKENVVVCHFERKVEKKPLVPAVSTEILVVDTEAPCSCVPPSTSVPELSPTIELEQRPMNIAVVSNGALSPDGAPLKKEKKVRIRLPRRRIFGCCSIF